MRIQNCSSTGWLSIWLVAGLLLMLGCSGGSPGDRANRGDFKVLEISTGLSPIFPYRIRELDGLGVPTTNIVEITNTSVLQKNLRSNNGLLPVGTFGTDMPPLLPDGNPGNHYMKIRFSHNLAPTSILSTAPSDAINSNLTTAIAMVRYDNVTETTQTMAGQPFVGGWTVVNDGFGGLEIVQAVRDNDGVMEVLHPIGAGFPQGFPNDVSLVAENTFVFVADTDDDLTDNEPFPDAANDNALLRVVISNAVQDTNGGVLEQEVCTATTVGADNRPPDVLGFTSPITNLAISPGSGQANVDPTTTVLVRFNKPVQPADVGSFFDPSVLVPPSAGISLNVTLAANNFNVIYYADPLSVGDFCNYRITPAYNLPGESTVEVKVNSTTVRDLNSVFLGLTVATTFDTGKGPGIVNAPVAPDALYVGMGGSNPGLKAIDLNGFGQGTGGYVVDPSGNTPPVFNIAVSRWPLNPNIGSAGINPNLSEGQTSIDAGSSGVFTLVQSSTGDTLLLGSPILGQVADIHIGCPLDMVFNNFNINVNAATANHIEATTGGISRGNSFSVVPHPNPPKFVFPPANPSQAIFAEEPTSTLSICFTTGPALDLLVSGNPTSDNAGNRGLFGHALDVFLGPAPPPASPPPPVPACAFAVRQQIGHFLYVLDVDNKQVLVVNSNRMTVLDTIRTPDPVNLAMAPNLRRLAVSNFASGSVSFIDIDPTSPTFHQVLSETRVLPGPAVISWQPDGEDVLVVHPQENALTIIGAFDFQVRKVVSGFLTEPIGLSVTTRYQGNGPATGVYYAYVLNRNGSIAVFESGPDGVNGIGFDDIIGTISGLILRSPKVIVSDIGTVNAGFLISHVDEFGDGQVSKLELTSSPGQQPLNAASGGFTLPPTFRQKEWKVTQTFGGTANANKGRLSGRSPRDMAIDEMINFAGTGSVPSTLAPGTALQTPMLHSDKGTFRGTTTGIPVSPKFLFIAITDRGVVDVFDYTTGEFVRAIDVGGTPAVLGSYWRQ